MRLICPLVSRLLVIGWIWIRKVHAVAENLPDAIKSWSVLILGIGINSLTLILDRR